METQILRFGVFELDVASRELRKSGMKIRLSGQPLQILLLLLDRRGEIVTRDQLRQALWSTDTFVEFDLALSSAVRRLRDALGDSAEQPRFIETIPRQGYRFIAPVERIGSTPTPAISPRRRGTPLIAAAIAIVVLVTAIAAFSMRRTSERPAMQKRINSIAVLPFENLTGNASQDYFADGLTEVLTTSLAGTEALNVISRNSASRFKHSSAPLPAIARELHVDAVVEASVLESGQHVQIAAHLLDATNDRYLWSRTYEGDVSDAFTIENDMARSIAGAIGRINGSRPPENAAAPHQIDPAAYDAFLKGIFAAGDGSRNAIGFFEEAVAKAPDFADAYAYLAQVEWQRVFSGVAAPRDIAPKAESAARKAIALDGRIARAHRMLGAILHAYYWDWQNGDRELSRALQLEPESIDSHRAAANALILAGRYAEAMDELERVRALDPLTPDPILLIGGAFRSAQQYDRAVAAFRKAIVMDPRVPRAHFQLGVTYVFMGRFDEAIRELEDADRLGPNPRFEAYIAYAYAAHGRPDEARRILAGLQERARRQYISSFGFALIYDVLGDRDNAIASLEQAYRDHAVELAQLGQYPPFRTIESDPRAQAVLRRVRPPRALRTATAARVVAGSAPSTVRSPAR